MQEREMILVTISRKADRAGLKARHLNVLMMIDLNEDSCE